MGSFKGHSFSEGGSGASTFPVWERKAKTAIVEVPGANGDIIQKFGRKSDTLNLLVTCTKTQLNSLYGDVGSSGSLVYHYETRSAYLDSITGPHEILTADKYVVILHLIG